MKSRMCAAALLSAALLLALTACATRDGGVRLSYAQVSGTADSVPDTQTGSGTDTAVSTPSGSTATGSTASGSAGFASAGSTSAGSVSPGSAPVSSASAGAQKATAKASSAGGSAGKAGPDADVVAGGSGNATAAAGQSAAPFSQSDALAAYNSAAARAQAGAVFDFSYALQGGTGESGSGHAAVRTAGGVTFSTYKVFDGGSTTVEFYRGDGVPLLLRWTNFSNAYRSPQTYSGDLADYVPLFTPSLTDAGSLSFSLKGGQLQVDCAPDASLFAHAQDFLAQMQPEPGVPAAVRMCCVIENGGFLSVAQTFTFSGGQTLTLRLDFSTTGAEAPVGVPDYAK